MPEERERQDERHYDHGQNRHDVPHADHNLLGHPADLGQDDSQQVDRKDANADDHGIWQDFDRLLDLFDEFAVPQFNGQEPKEQGTGKHPDGSDSQRQSGFTNARQELRPDRHSSKHLTSVLSCRATATTSSIQRIHAEFLAAGLGVEGQVEAHVELGGFVCDCLEA